MPTITANHCEMFYEIDDFTDPWVKEKETVWLQHGVGRNTKILVSLGASAGAPVSRAAAGYAWAWTIR